MSSNILSSRMMVGAAIVGLVGAAGMFIYEQVYAEKRRSMLVKEVARLDKQMNSMRLELENLRELQELQKESQLRRTKPKKRVRREIPVVKVSNESGDAVDAPEQSYASDSEYFTDYQSIVGTDPEMDSDQFYDVPTDEESDDTLREGSLRNGRARIKDIEEDTSEKEDIPKSPTKGNST